MRTKEECGWCMSIQHIEREYDLIPNMPEEFKHRCSACHEQWWESHIECDCCHEMIDTELHEIHYDKYTDMYICFECKDKHGFI